MILSGAKDRAKYTPLVPLYCSLASVYSIVCRKELGSLCNIRIYLTVKYSFNCVKLFFEKIGEQVF